ncbi:hypothetical protein D9N54_25130, partial [Salmonella enterica]|nr:hypothetical protein [Salmonella enterica]
MRLSYSILPLFLCFGSSYAFAAEEHAPDAAQANNPLANMTAFNMQNYYIGDVSDTDQDANQFWFRYAQPFSLGESKWLLRSSLPINTYP